MLFEKTNIERELGRKRDVSYDILRQAQDILGFSSQRDLEVLRRLKKKEIDPNDLNIELLPEDKGRVYDIEQIENVCIKYRLKFLDSGYFKSDFPYEAIMAVNEFEKKYSTKIKKFNIIAPAKMFKLEDVNKDPLLLAQLSSGKYYLLHKWGNDLAWHRGILSYPFRSIYSLFFSLILLAGIIAWSVPSSWIDDNFPEAGIRAWLWVHSFIGLFGFSLFLGCVFQRNFSNCEWKSKYFNS